MLGRTQDTAARRLSDLRKSQVDDSTLGNLLSVLTAKLELCSRLPVCEWEAAHQNDESCADAFKRLAEEERRSCSYVLDCLQQYLERRATPTPRSDA